MTTTTPIYGTQAPNAPTGQVNVFDPNTGKALTGAGKFNPNTGAAITSEQLSPVTPLVLPDTTATPTYGGLPGVTEAITNQSQAQKDAAASQTTSDTANKDLLGAILGQSNNSNVDYTAQDNAKIESDKYTSMLEQEQLANRRAIENLQKNNPGGTFGGALTQEVNNINTKSLSKQADIAILQSAANRNYDTAKSIADRQILMNMEQSKIKIDALKIVADNASTIADRDFQVALNEKIKTEQRAYDKQKTAEDAISTLKLNVAQYAGSDKLSIMTQLSAIDTTKPGAYDKAVTIAGKYSQDPLDRELKKAQIASANRANQPSGAEAPTTKEINGKTMQWDPVKKKFVEPSIEGGLSGADSVTIAKNLENIKTIKGLSSNMVGIRNSSGQIKGKEFISIWNRNKVSNWKAEVDNVLSQLTTAELARIKGTGVTFGALSEGERVLVAAAASSLNAAKNFTGTGENKVWDGTFEVSEDFVKEKLEEIQMYSELDFITRTGMSSKDYEAQQYLDSINSTLEEATSPYANEGYLQVNY